MRMVKDEDMPLRLAYPMEVAKKISEATVDSLSNFIINQLNDDDRFKDFTYSDAATYIQKISSLIFLNFIKFTGYVASQCPGSDFNAQELFEEVVKGMRCIADFEEPNEKEYANGIKKVKVIK